MLEYARCDSHYLPVLMKLQVAILQFTTYKEGEQAGDRVYMEPSIKQIVEEASEWLKNVNDVVSIVPRDRRKVIEDTIMGVLSEQLRDFAVSRMISNL